MNGSSMSDAQLAEIGVSRTHPDYGNVIYTVPCAICGEPIKMRSFTTEKAYRCSCCKSKAIEHYQARVKDAKRKYETEMAKGYGTDYVHFHRFDKAAAKFGVSYYPDIERARTVIDKFDSMPEVVACIELLHIGARVIVHQKVSDYTVDFCLPDEKVILEIDGSLYHKDATRTFARDNALSHMLGGEWTIKHVPADAVAKNHAAFGRNMRKMLNKKRKELGLKELAVNQLDR